MGFDSSALSGRVEFKQDLHNTLAFSAFFSIRILLGTLKSTGDDPDQIELHSQEYLYNYDFDPWSYENDVALIKLPEPVVFTGTLLCLKRVSG